MSNNEKMQQIKQKCDLIRQKMNYTAYLISQIRLALNKAKLTATAQLSRQSEGSYNVNASAIVTSDKPIKSYTWTTSDGVTGVGKDTVLAFNSAGQKSVTLIVEDEAGNIVTDVAYISLSAIATQTYISAYFNSMNNPSDYEIDVTATATSSAGAIIRYDWYVNGVKAANATTANVQLQVNGQGTYRIRLVVTDVQGNTAENSANYTIASGINVSLIASANRDGGPVSYINAYASASGGSGGFRYYWSIDNGAEFEAGANYTFNNVAQGRFHDIKVRAVDMANKSGAATTNVYVDEPVNNNNFSINLTGDNKSYNDVGYTMLYANYTLNGGAVAAGSVSNKLWSADYNANTSITFVTRASDSTKFDMIIVANGMAGQREPDAIAVWNSKPTNQTTINVTHSGNAGGKDASATLAITSPLWGQPAAPQLVDKSKATTVSVRRTASYTPGRGEDVEAESMWADYYDITNSFKNSASNNVASQVYCEMSEVHTYPLNGSFTTQPVVHRVLGGNTMSVDTGFTSDESTTRNYFAAGFYYILDVYENAGTLANGLPTKGAFIGRAKITINVNSPSMPTSKATNTNQYEAQVVWLS